MLEERGDEEEEQDDSCIIQRRFCGLSSIKEPRGE